MSDNRRRPRDRGRWVDSEDALPVRRVAPPASTTASPNPWRVHAEEIALRLSSLESDSLRVALSAQKEPRERLLEIRLEYVGEPTNARPWVSIHATGPALLNHLTSSAIAPDAALRPPWDFPLTSAAEATAPSVLIWRDPGAPIVCALLVVRLLHEVLGVSDAHRVRVHWDEADGPTVRQRTERAAMIVRASPQRRVLGTCTKCGQDLRDREFAAIGIGPECIKSYPAEQVRLRRQLNQAVRSGMTPRLNAKHQNVWLADIRRDWNLT